MTGLAGVAMVMCYLVSQAAEPTFLWLRQSVSPCGFCLQLQSQDGGRGGYGIFYIRTIFPWSESEYDR